MTAAHTYTVNAVALRAMFNRRNDGEQVLHRRDEVPEVERTRVIPTVTEDGLAEWFADRAAQRQDLPDYITGAFCRRVHSTNATTVEFELAGTVLWTSSCGAAGALTDQPDPDLAWCSACWDLDNGHTFARGADGITRCLVSGCGERKIDVVDQVTRWCRRCNGGAQ